MPYAIRKDGQGWRAVNSQADVDTATETYSDTQPAFTPPAQPNADGFMQAIKAAAGGIVGANALAVAYPLLPTAIQQGVWADVQALIVDAQTKSVINATQYSAIKAAAVANNIPVTL